MQLQNQLVSVIIPSYNDKEIIMPYFEALSAYSKEHTECFWEFIYVDDGSTDGSVEVLQRIASEHAGVICIQLSRNWGQQKALLCGMCHARGSFVVTLDGDFQYPPEVLTRLVEKAHEGYDLVSGVRVHRQDTLWCILCSILGQFLIRVTIHPRITDFGAVKCFSRRVVDGLIRESSSMTQVYGLAYRLSERVGEVSVPHLKRYHGVSKWNIWKRMGMYLEITMVCLRVRRSGVAWFFSVAVVTVGMSAVMYFMSSDRMYLGIGGTSGIAMVLACVMMGKLWRIHSWNAEDYIQTIHGVDHE